MCEYVVYAWINMLKQAQNNKILIENYQNMQKCAKKKINCWTMWLKTYKFTLICYKIQVQIKTFKSYNYSLLWQKKKNAK